MANELLASARRAVLGTLGPGGRPRLVPIAYAIDDTTGALYTALDDKPKSLADPRQLARVRDILARPQVSVLVDHWSEDWSDLAWLRLDGEATLLEPPPAADTTDDRAADDASGEHSRAVSLLRARYPQYAAHELERRPILRIGIRRSTTWTARR